MGRKSKEQIKTERMRELRHDYEVRSKRLTFSLRVDPEKEPELYNWLTNHRPTNAYLRRLIEEDIKKSK